MAELYAAHGPMVLGLCRLLLRDPVDADDAAQQVFVNAQRALLGGTVAREPAAWLATIARNECRSRTRARMREPLSLPALPSDIPDPLASAIHNADLDALWTALSELPRRQRKAFLLRELGGLSYAELGAALGVTRPAVESLLFRARRQLRSALPAVNATYIPVALREQLVRLVPLGTPGGGASFGAKIAAVTVGVGLGAAGVVELPKQHARRVRTRTPAVAPVFVSPVQHVRRGRPSPSFAAPREARGKDAEHHADRRGHDPAEPAGPEHQPEVEPAETRDSSGRDGGDGSHDGGNSGEGG